MPPPIYDCNYFTCLHSYTKLNIHYCNYLPPLAAVLFINTPRPQIAQRSTNSTHDHGVEGRDDVTGHDLVDLQIERRELYVDRNGWRCVFYCCVAVYCSVLQCVAVCCSVLQCVAVCVAVWRDKSCMSIEMGSVALFTVVLQCVAVCCSVLQCVAVSVAVCCSMCCSMCCSVCCSVL